MAPVLGPHPDISLGLCLSPGLWTCLDPCLGPGQGPILGASLGVCPVLGSVLGPGDCPSLGLNLCISLGSCFSCMLRSCSRSQSRSGLGLSLGSGPVIGLKALPPI